MVYSSIFFMSYIMAKMDFIWDLSWKAPRLKEKMTSSMSKASPLWNLTPERTLMVYLVPFSSILGRSTASAGSMRPSLVRSKRRS